MTPDASGPQQPCPFCEIVAGRAPATVLSETPTALVILPLGPVVAGHALVIPRAHVADMTEDPDVSAQVMRVAAEWARPLGPCNVITSKGREATQSVFHLHLHVVPRRENDGLALPWYSGKRKPAATGRLQQEPPP